MFSVYLEFAAYFPNRSGSEAVYLEQAYPKPRYFLPLAFAVQTVVLSFSSGNSVVCANYLFATGDYSATNWETKGLAIGVYTIAFLTVVFSTKWSYRASNAIGLIKLITLIFIAITGLVVLGGHTRVKNPTANFHNAFEGTATIYGVTNALIKIIFSCMLIVIMKLESVSAYRARRCRIRERFQRCRRGQESGAQDAQQWVHSHHNRVDSLHAGQHCGE
jgi:amino acid transporter